MTFPDLQSLSDQLAGLTAVASPRVVAVTGADGGRLSGIIWRSGLVATAHEGLGGEDEVNVTFADGSTGAAQIAGRDPSTDVALLKLETGAFGDWTAAPIPVPGALTLLVGRGEYSALSGLASVTEVGPAWRSMRGGEIAARIMLSLRLSGRSEGSAVVAPDGTLIGMAVSGPRRRTLTIPHATVARAVATLAEKGYVPRGYLGVSLHPLGKGAGAIVVGIEAESPAALGGFLIGDIITTWDGAPVHSVGEVSNHLTGSAVGSKARLGVLRGGSGLELDIAIGERPRA